MTESQTMKFGDMQIHPLTDGPFKLDGGAMFGIVPKPLWRKTNPPDDANRIEMSAGVLLIQTRDRNVLVDTGLGTKLSEKLRSIYAFDRSRLLGALADLGLEREDIDTVILTHLHLDHAGGATFRDDSGQPVPTFPNARHLVQAAEWKAALAENPLTKGSYVWDDFLPLKEHGLLELIDGDCRVADGITVKHTGGHTQGHQIVLVESAGGTACYPGDLIPTASHLRLPFIMAYDVFPLKVVQEKEALLNAAVDGGWLLIWQHDPHVKMGRLHRQEGKVCVEPCPHV